MQRKNDAPNVSVSVLVGTEAMSVDSMCIIIVCFSFVNAGIAWVSCISGGKYLGSV